MNSVPADDPTSKTDPALVALLRAVEAGRTTPRHITLLVGAWLVFGELVPSVAFRNRSAAIWREDVGDREFKKFRGTKEEKQARIEEVVGPLASAISAPEGTELPAALTLVRTMIGSGVGSTFNLPTLRIPLAAVQAWSVTGYTVIPPKSGSTVSLGVSF